MGDTGSHCRKWLDPAIKGFEAESMRNPFLRKIFSKILTIHSAEEMVNFNTNKQIKIQPMDHLSYVYWVVEK